MRRGDVPARYRRTCDKPTMEVRGGNGWRGSEKFTVSQLLSMCGIPWRKYLIPCGIRYNRIMLVKVQLNVLLCSK